MDLSNSESLETTLTDLENFDKHSLIGIIENAEKLLIKAKEQLSRLERSETFTNTADTTAITDNVEYYDNVLGDDLAAAVDTHLKTLEYTPTGVNNPGVYLYGDHKYTYSKATEDLEAVPVASSPVITEVLDTINKKLGLNYNSVLINKYQNKNVTLSWHKDDEEEVDVTVPITTLSLGAVRRFQITDNKEKTQRHEFYNKILKSNSLFVMKPVIQRQYFHQLAIGRSSKRSECGTRCSLTFRKIDPTSTISQPVQTHSINDAKKNCDAVVFGSSLTKGLIAEKLSTPGRVFDVFTHGGARVKTIINKMKKVYTEGKVRSEYVRDVFFVCGGNDVENSFPDSDLDDLMGNYNELAELAMTYFPNANINFFSLIPRRAVYENHIDRMHMINYRLKVMCDKRVNTRFINVFSHFLDPKNYYNTMLSNLFKPEDQLHFTSVGSSVLAKVIMGVAYRPHKH